MTEGSESGYLERACSVRSPVIYHDGKECENRKEIKTYGADSKVILQYLEFIVGSSRYEVGPVRSSTVKIFRMRRCN